MPHTLFVPVGGVAIVPLAYNYPQPLPPVDPTRPDLHPAPADARVAIEAEEGILKADMSEDHREVAIVGLAPGAGVVRICIAGAEDVLDVTVAVPVANGILADTSGVRYDLSKVAPPKRAQAQHQPDPKDAPDPRKDESARRDDEVHKDDDTSHQPPRGQQPTPQSHQQQQAHREGARRPSA